ncbi:M48 family metalloprotease [Undibacter mobilis]|uniref:LysM peptidoglycan-binding domain-containing protein n=1 Tax=Undibacter mobilis TaxID=2292256 RepID=A0A371B897_9BRAD|nr:M48 family metalloprotease [Undibacter mobilis]RDV03784.1 LysM peptidoglycan-binding domain-containing protein [Undibacter mobilis]
MRKRLSERSWRKDRPWHAWLAVPLLAVVLAGCTQSPDTPRQVSLPIPRTIDRDAPAPATVRENARILASYGGIYDNPQLQAEIEQTVAKLVAASERPDLKYQVTMLNSPAINAFALPNGHLYISRGLVALAADKAELASVLAHEMGHVIARHAAIREEQARQTALVSQVVSEVLSDPNMGALALAKSRLTLASFSRAQEFEADGIGVGISSRAGFDSFGAARFLTAMQRNADLKSGSKSQNADPTVADFMSSHPATPERVKNALANARQFSGPGNGARDRDAYLASIDGMVYGEDPSEGFARGRRFVHPKLGFTFVAPNHFSLDNTAQAVLGLKDGGDEALRLDVVSVPAEQRLSDYLKSGWIDNVDAASAEEFTVNGFPAATASAKGERWSFRLFAVRFGSDVYRFIFAARNLTTENDRAFRESVSSFRRMSLKESAGVKPLHIRIVTVKPGDTIDKLAERMASDHKLNRFLLLNGFSATDKLKPGEKVKLVME